MKTKLIACLFAFTLSAFTATMAANPPGWTDDYAKAVEKAKAENKKLLLDFTGSDWCGYCKLLDKEVFATPHFKTWAKDYVLVKVDFPKSTPISEKVKKQNAELKQQHPFGGYPTVVILDAEGKELAKKVGYKPGSGPEVYLQALGGESKTVTAKQ
jgi:thioredoxin-related protein